MSESFKQYIEKVRIQRPKQYSKIIISLGTARDNEELPIQGNNIYFEQVDNPVTLKLNEITNDNISAVNYRNIKGAFYRLFLSNISAGGYLIIYYWISEEMRENNFSIVDYNQLIQNYVTRDDSDFYDATHYREFIGSSICSAVAGQYSTIQIANPVLSNKQFLLKRLHVFGATGINILARTGTLITLGSETGKCKLGFSASSTLINALASATLVANPDCQVNGITFGTNVYNGGMDNIWFYLAENDVILIQGITVNVEIRASYEFLEFSY